MLLIDSAGRATRPVLPSDPCGVPRTEVAAAFDQLAFRITMSYTFDTPAAR